ncbi:MAG: hypothetical protein ACK4JY_00180 [Brevundimonas sp.]|uniref:hypothetical protein n=1 Tax=Brevundimonas sp. TaxID=1871086 RepID=UPI0039191DAE
MLVSDPAPIALFAYRRADHLSKTLDALEACPEFERSPVFVFSDGPKDDASAEVIAEIASVRSMLNMRLRSNMSVVEAATNRGLAASVIAGVTQLCAEYGRVIVIEDDLIVSPVTLTWLNAALDRFEANAKVFQISAYQWWNPLLRRRRDGLFGRMAVSWGWATWKRAWDAFDPDATGWEALESDKTLRRAFDMDGSYPLSEMLRLQIDGRIDSWAIRWAWSVFRRDGLVLYPPRSLVRNIGFDETGTHNSIGKLKNLISPPPMLWAEAVMPDLPATTDGVVTDEKIVQRGLRHSGAMRNRRIVAVLRALGVWRKN